MSSGSDSSSDEFLDTLSLRPRPPSFDLRGAFLKLQAKHKKSPLSLADTIDELLHLGAIATGSTKAVVARWHKEAAAARNKRHAEVAAARNKKRARPSKAKKKPPSQEMADAGAVQPPPSTPEFTSVEDAIRHFESVAPPPDQVDAEFAMECFDFGVAARPSLVAPSPELDLASRLAEFATPLQAGERIYGFQRKMWLGVSRCPRLLAAASAHWRRPTQA